MEAVWIAVRNFLVLLALSWIGVSAAPERESAKRAPVEQTSISAPQAACGWAACDSMRASYNADECG